MKQILILYSGGQDSLVMLKLATKLCYTPVLLHFDYGQKFAETRYAELAAGKFECDLIKRKLDIRGVLTGDEEKGKYPRVSEWYVPARNTIFVSMAAHVAESLGIEEIWLGANYEDYINRFPDCTQEWVSKMNKVLELGCAKPIKLVAPLLGFSKCQIDGLCKAWGLTEYLSGYGDLQN